MTKPWDRIDAAVTAMLRDRRPRRYDADPEELAALRAAARLRAGRPGADLPGSAFVESLEARLRRAEAAAPRAGASRRTFLRTAGLAAAAGVAAGVGGERVVQRLRDSDTGAYRPELVPAGGAWTDVAALADVRTRGPLRFSHGSIAGVLVATPQGGVEALSGVCTHMGCILDVDVPGRRLVCPCHPASFGLDGTPQTGYTGTTVLPRLRSRISGERVEVFLA